MGEPLMARAGRPHKAQHNPSLVVELAGLAGTGKTTLTGLLAQCGPDIRVAADISVRRPDHLAAFLRTTPQLVPLLLTPRHNSRLLTWEEIKSVAYLKGWERVLRQPTGGHPGIVLLDQGPIFRMATLHAFGPEMVRTPAARPWWNEMFKQWASVLDLVFWLDAPNPILQGRIDSRDRWHMVKGKSEQEVSQFLDSYRTSYHHVLLGMSLNAGPRLMALDTGRTPVYQLANSILAALHAAGNRD